MPSPCCRMRRRSSATRTTSAWSNTPAAPRARCSRTSTAGRSASAPSCWRMGSPACSRWRPRRTCAGAAWRARCSRGLLTWAWEHGAAHAYLQVDAQQRAGARGVPQVRLRDGVHVPLLRPAGRADDANDRRASTRLPSSSASGCGQRRRDVRDRRVVHGRTGRRRDHRHRRQLGLVRPRLRHLFERSEDGGAGGAARRRCASTARCPRRRRGRWPRARLARSRASIAVAITGVAGPGGGTPDKPVGMVCFAWARHGACRRRRSRASFPGDRPRCGGPSVVAALEGLLATWSRPERAIGRSA